MVLLARLNLPCITGAVDSCHREYRLNEAES